MKYVMPAIAVLVVLTYCYLTINKQASVEAFVGMATYVIKKTFDDMKKGDVPAPAAQPVALPPAA